MYTATYSLDQKITLQYVLTVLGVVFASWFLHELAHWTMLQALGYEGSMSFNGTYFSPGSSVTASHNNLVSAAGPVFTLLQALVAFFYLKRDWVKNLYPFLFVPFYMRFMAVGISAFNPNDEARISRDFGLGLYTLPLLMSAVLFFLIYVISKKYNLGWKFQLVTTLLVMLFSSILILGDQMLKLRLL